MTAPGPDPAGTHPRSADAAPPDSAPALDHAPRPAGAKRTASPAPPYPTPARADSDRLARPPLSQYWERGRRERSEPGEGHSPRSEGHSSPRPTVGQHSGARPPFEV